MTPLASIAAVLLFCGQAAAAVPDTAAVAVVNGTVITKDEFLLAAAPLRAGLVGLRGDAVRRAMDAVVERAVSAKLLRLAAVDEGVLAGEDQDSFRESWRRENERRQAAKARREVVYGPLTFSEEAFYSYSLSQLDLRLRQLHAGRSAPVSEARIRAAYASQRDSSFRRPDAVTILEVRTVSESADTLEALRAAIVSAAAVRDIDGRLGSTAVVYELDERTAHLLGEDRPSALEAARSLPAGAVAGWLQEGRERVLLKCTSRVPGGYVPLEEVRELLRAKIEEDEYRIACAARRAGADVRLNRELLDAITVELSGGGR